MEKLDFLIERCSIKVKQQAADCKEKIRGAQELI